MARDLSCIAIPTQSPPSSAVPKQAAAAAAPQHLAVPSSPFTAKWPAEPNLRKVHLLHRLHQIAPVPPIADSAAEEPRPLPILFERDNAPGTSGSLSFFSHGTQKKQESSERDEFYANLGSAIRILREETPFLFYQDLNYSIYRDDITFRDPRNAFTGIDNYKLIFWALRFHGQMFFKAIWVEILRIWQPSDGVIIVRWAVRGIPRVPWEAQGLFEGTSEYKLDKNGMIYEHKVDNVAPSNPWYLKTAALKDLLPSMPRASPTPTYFERLTHLLWMKLAIVKCSSWERLYFALIATLDVQSSTQWLVCYFASRELIAQ